MRVHASKYGQMVESRPGCERGCVVRGSANLVVVHLLCLLRRLHGRHFAAVAQLLKVGGRIVPTPQTL